MSTPYQYPPPGNQPAYDPSLSPYGNPVSGSYPAQGPQSGDQPYSTSAYGASHYGHPDSRQAFGQPQYGQPPYGQPPYGQPQYGEPGFGGPPPPQPRNKKPWIIGGAVLGVLAIVATVLIIVLNKHDHRDTTPRSGGSSSGGESSLTCGPDDSGIKVDPKTGKSITCEGGTKGKGEAAKVADALNGSWTVVLTIAKLDGSLIDPSGKTLGPGDSPNFADSSWTIISGLCTDENSPCTASVTSMNTAESFSFTLEDGKWVGETTVKYWCDSSETTSSLSDVKYEIEAAESKTLKGTRTVSDNGECGEVFHEVDDVVMTKL